MSRLGFIGTGHIAAPMIRHLAEKGHDIIATHRNRTVSGALANEIGIALGEPQEVIDASDIVFLCLRPLVAASVLEPLLFRAGQQIVSVMAEVTMDELASLCAPAGDFVQTIPLGYLEIGGCPLAAHGNHDLLASLFAPENPVVPVADEASLNAHFAICAFVPGVLDLMATAGGWLGQQTGDADAAEFYTTQLVGGFLAAMKKGVAGRLVAERDALATEGTLSLQLTEGLRDGGAHKELAATLAAIGERLNNT